MTFFNDIGKKISKTSHQVIKKGKDITDVAKYNSMINDEEKIVNSNLLEIGKLYFELYGDNPAPEFTEKIEAINQANDNISDYRKKIQLLKGAVVCASCGNEVSSESAFCSFCGAEIEKPEEKTITCKTCGQSIPSDSVFCASCGAPVAAEEEGTDAAEQSQVENKCPQCGAVLEEDSVFCTSCGCRIVVDAEEVTEEEPETAKCPVCGEPAADNIRFCTKCGSKVR